MKDEFICVITEEGRGGRERVVIVSGTQQEQESRGKDGMSPGLQLRRCKVREGLDN
jgi:hypothetical protein